MKIPIYWPGMSFHNCIVCLIVHILPTNCILYHQLHRITQRELPEGESQGLGRGAVRLDGAEGAFPELASTVNYENIWNTMVPELCSIALGSETCGTCFDKSSSFCSISLRSETCGTESWKKFLSFCSISLGSETCGTTWKWHDFARLCSTSWIRNMWNRISKNTCRGIRFRRKIQGSDTISISVELLAALHKFIGLHNNDGFVMIWTRWASYSCAIDLKYIRKGSGDLQNV